MTIHGQSKRLMPFIHCDNCIKFWLFYRLSDTGNIKSNSRRNIEDNKFVDAAGQTQIDRSQAKLVYNDLAAQMEPETIFFNFLNSKNFD